MPADLLASARAKLGRAREHADELEAAFAALDTEQAFKVSYDADPGSKSVLVKVAAVPDYTRPKLIIGDTVTNLRAVLDHSAWALVTAHRTGPISAKDGRQIQFPTYLTAAAFRNGVAGRLPGVRPAAGDALSRFQPYRRTEAGRGVRLVWRLSNRDKHKLLVISASSISYFDTTQVSAVGGKVTRAENLIEAGHVLHPGTELARVYFQPDPGSTRAGIHIEHKFRARPTFGFMREVHPEIENAVSTCADVLSTVETLL